MESEIVKTTTYSDNLITFPNEPDNISDFNFICHDKLKYETTERLDSSNIYNPLLINEKSFNYQFYDFTEKCLKNSDNFISVHEFKEEENFEIGMKYNIDNESPQNYILKLDKLDDIYTILDKQIIRKFSKTLFKTKNFGFLKKKTKIISPLDNDGKKIMCFGKKNKQLKFIESNNCLRIDKKKINQEINTNFIDSLKETNYCNNKKIKFEKINLNTKSKNRKIVKNNNANVGKKSGKLNYNMDPKINSIYLNSCNEYEKSKNLSLNSFNSSDGNEVFHRLQKIGSGKSKCGKIKEILSKNYEKLMKINSDKIEKIKDKIENKDFRIDTKVKIKIKWTEAEDKKLIKIKQDFPYLSWLQISQFFENRNKTECMNRFLMVINPNLKKGKWTDDEDQILIDWVKENGVKNWAKLMKKDFLKGRNSKQIRERWLNYLCPKMKKCDWNEENEKILLENYLIFGSRWTKISEFIENSSENTVKNKFYSMLRKTANKYLSSNDKINNKFEKSNECKQNLSSNQSDEDKKNNCDKLLFLDHVKNKNKKTKIIEKEISDTFLKFEDNDFSYAKDNTYTINGKISTCQNSFYQDNNEINHYFEDEKIKSEKKRKKNNYSLDILLNFLPLLLEEKKIDYQKIIEKEKNMEEIQTDQDLRFNKKNICENYSFEIKNPKLFNFKINETQKPKINIKDGTSICDEKENKNSHLLNSLSKTFQKRRDLIRDELMQKINESNMIKNTNQNFSFMRKYDSLNNINNDLLNYSNTNLLNQNSNLIKNMIIFNNSNNESFLSNEELNMFNNNLSMNFSNSNNYNSLNFSDFIDLENNFNNSCNSFNKSFCLNNSYNNISNNIINYSENKNFNCENSNQTKSISMNKFKSSIMLNLQMNVLNKIIERIRLNFVQKFFSSFKKNIFDTKDYDIADNKDYLKENN